MDYRWCRFYPYRTLLENSGATELTLKIRNHLFKDADVTVELKHDDMFVCAESLRTFTIAPKNEASVVFQLEPSGELSAGKSMVTADITINGRRIGEYAEAMIDVKIR